MGQSIQNLAGQSLYRISWGSLYTESRGAVSLHDLVGQSLLYRISWGSLFTWSRGAVSIQNLVGQSLYRISWGSLYTESRGAVSAMMCAQDAACMTGVKCTRRAHVQSGSPGLASSLFSSRQIRYQAGKICRLLRLSGRVNVIRHLLHKPPA